MCITANGFFLDSPGPRSATRVEHEDVNVDEDSPPAVRIVTPLSRHPHPHQSMRPRPFLRTNRAVDGDVSVSLGDFPFPLPVDLGPSTER